MQDIRTALHYSYRCQDEEMRDEISGILVNAGGNLKQEDVVGKCVDVKRVKTQTLYFQSLLFVHDGGM